MRDMVQHDDCHRPPRILESQTTARECVNFGGTAEETFCAGTVWSSHFLRHMFARVRFVRRGTGSMPVVE